MFIICIFGRTAITIIRLVSNHYLNTLTVCLRGYDGHPSPENLVEEFSLAVSVGGALDFDELTSAIEKDDLAGGTRRVRQSLTQSSWGASGSAAELLIDVPAWLSGLASVPVLWDAISRRVLRLGKARPVTAEASAEAARSMLPRACLLPAASCSSACRARGHHAK